MDTYNSMPIELRNWIKEQLRSMERGELDDDKKGLMLDFIEKNLKNNKGEIFAILLKEVLEEEKNDVEKIKEDILEQLYDDGEECYGAKPTIGKVYSMELVGNWWNYYVEFDETGEQLAVYIENKDGRKLCEDKRLLVRHIEGTERLVLVGCNYELKEYPDDYNVEETWIINC